MSEQKAKDLAAIEPPDSIRQLLRFLDELLVPTAKAQIGNGGRGADSLSAEIAARHTGTAQVATLLESHSVTVGDISRFLRWLTLWHDKRAEMEVIKAPVPEQVVTHTHSTSKETVYVSVPTSVTSTVVQSIIRPAEPPKQPAAATPSSPTISEERPPSTAKSNASSRTESVAATKTEAPAKKEARASLTEAKASYRTEQPDVISRAWREPTVAEPIKVERGLSTTQLIWGANLVGGSYAIGAMSQQRPGPLLTSQVAPSERVEPIFKRFERPEPEVTVTVQSPLPKRTAHAEAPSSPVLRQEDKELQHKEVASTKQKRKKAEPGKEDSEELVETLPVHVIQPQGLLKARKSEHPKDFLYHQVLGKGIFPAMGSMLSATPMSPISLLIGGKGIQSTPDGHFVPDEQPTQVPDRSLSSSNRSELTLIAPDIQVASEESERGGAAVSLSWRDLVQGMGELSEGDVELLTKVLPAGAQAIYPALPEGSLGKHSFNVPLAPGAVQSLLHGGYGATMGVGDLPKSKRSMEGTPVARSMKGKIVPTQRPMGEQAGVMSGPSSALGVAGEGQARRTGVLDFMGLPVRLAPSLGGKSELQEEVAARTGQTTGPSGSPIRPRDFGPVRSRIFPTFQSLEAEPERAAWQRAAPSFGMRSADPISVLTPDVRSKRASAIDPAPQLGGGVHSSPQASIPSSTVSHGLGSPSVPAQTESPASPLTSLSRPTLPAISDSLEGAAPATSSITSIPTFQPMTAAGSSGLPSLSAPSMTTQMSPSSLTPATPSIGGVSRQGSSPSAPMGRPPSLSAEQSQPSSGLVGSAKPDLSLPSKPSAPTPALRTAQAPTAATLPQPRPTMLYAAGAPRGAVQPKISNMAVQASRGHVTAQQTQTVHQSQKVPEQAQKSTEGKKAAEVQLMANEVWAILKRRIAAERDRAGRW